MDDVNAPDSGILLFRNTMRITEGHLAPYREAVEKAVRFVEEHGPQVMVEVFIDERKLLAHSFQMYRDSASVRAHWKMSEPYIQEVMKHCRVERFEVFGEPDADVAAGVRKSLDDEVSPSFAARFTGFTRFDALRSAQ
ncbi:hypothetical protein [Streptomyces fumanus]|uniref:ABM domain-containing protein n=1 Tax=Streptomyces fumanus TaxID=67302 RepID=A0A919B039_9ACTN|nr:hypothetical protein [Streptomyces fumanus]GHF35616.1 hypothetical protein GCM10018772_71210 [Streptomyces fumanus]